MQRKPVRQRDDPVRHIPVEAMRDHRSGRLLADHRLVQVFGQRSSGKPEERVRLKSWDDYLNVNAVSHFYWAGVKVLLRLTGGEDSTAG